MGDAWQTGACSNPGFQLGRRSKGPNPTTAGNSLAHPLDPHNHRPLGGEVGLGEHDSRDTPQSKPSFFYGTGDLYVEAGLKLSNSFVAQACGFFNTISLKTVCCWSVSGFLHALLNLLYFSGFPPPGLSI